MDYNNLSRNELLVARAECDKSLLFFIKFWFRVLKGQRFIVNWHHEEICKELDNIENYRLELLNINIPPRFSKTEMCAVNFISRGIGMNPSSNWLYITASDELRSQVSVSIRDIVTHPYFHTMYGVELKPDLNSKNLWRTKQGGGLKTATIFGQITGFGAGQLNEDVLNEIRTFEGCIVADDLNKTDDSETENAINTKVSRTFFNTVLSRKNSQDTPIINIQQRAGVTDITSELMEFYKDSPKAKFMIYPIISPDGVPLWEKKFDLESIELLRTNNRTARVFDCQYMQKPVRGEGILFDKLILNYFSLSDKLGNEDTCLACIDVADGGGDYFAAIIGKLIGERMYVVDVVCNKEGTDSNMKYMVAKKEKWAIKKIFSESNAMGSIFSRQLNALTGNVTPFHSSTNKITRITMEADVIKSQFYFLKEKEQNNEYATFFKMLTDFNKEGKNIHDDAPDVTAGLAFHTQRFLPRLWKNRITI